jgi:tetratricopeptide (TPR) repeat protein
MLVSTVAGAIGCGIFSAAPSLAADEANSFADRARRAFENASHLVHMQPTNDVALVTLGRAAFDWAEIARNDDERAAVAQTGTDAMRRLISRSPTNAAAHYWLGMNLGELARTKSLGALKLVREMEEEFQRARELDEHIDFAGPDRSLGLLYRDAPGWPASIGSKKKAREHLERAVQLHPESPDNQLALLESYEDWGERQSFERQLQITEKALAAARQKFTGADWEASWHDWNQRWSTMKAKASDVGKKAPTKGAR